MVGAGRAKLQGSLATGEVPAVDGPDAPGSAEAGFYDQELD
jgi:hypothetical protein